VLDVYDDDNERWFSLKNTFSEEEEMDSKYEISFHEEKKKPSITNES
jgi:hypothetical protein